MIFYTINEHSIVVDFYNAPACFCFYIVFSWHMLLVAIFIRVACTMLQHVKRALGMQIARLLQLATLCCIVSPHSKIFTFSTNIFCCLQKVLFIGCLNFYSHFLFYLCQINEHDFFVFGSFKFLLLYPLQFSFFISKHTCIV